MKRYNICLIGFGNVGRALVRLLEDKRALLRDRHGIEWRLSGLMTRRMGALAAPQGFDPFGDSLPAPLPEGTTVREWLGAAHADVLFEASSLAPRTGEPAISYLRAALERGLPAITANKGPVVHGYRALRQLAGATGGAFRFESAVMDGAPIFSLFRRTLPAIEVAGFRGILNSTTNVILAEMERGLSLEEGVREAQRRGLAETDPSADIDGWDAAVKVAALVQVILEVPILLDDVRREGIRSLDGETVRAARRAGTPYKLVCWARREEGGVAAGVGPERVPLADPLASISGSTSVVRFETDMLPGLSIVEHEPGPVTTAYGMLSDFLEIAGG